MALVPDEELLAIWRAMWDGARARGSAGASDRAAITRAIGLPFYQQPSRGGGAAKPLGDDAFARRLETALARAQAAARLRGHTDDTNDDDDDDDAQ
jgi:hypothetical protein